MKRIQFCQQLSKN
uniref:Uncharacterized protein n=1 Tax=Rhizophora mucronata TaxID=61149 RepID=A0A2P2Q408_RHIMU